MAASQHGRSPAQQQLQPAPEPQGIRWTQARDIMSQKGRLWATGPVTGGHMREPQCTTQQTLSGPATIYAVRLKGNGPRARTWLAP